MKNDKKYILGVTGDFSLVFQRKQLLQQPLICYCMMENHFDKSKTPQTYLLMRFNGNKVMFDYKWKMTENIFWEWLVIFKLGVSKKNNATVIFKMLFHDGKSFFRIQKFQKLIYLWGSMPLKLCLVVYEKWLKICFGSDRWCFVSVSKKTIVKDTFNTLLYDGIEIMFDCTWKMTKNIFWE